VLEVKGAVTSLGIGDAARAAGVAPSAIRYYESAGILPKSPRQNGIRRFTPDVIDMIKVIRFCRAAGVPVRQLRWIADERPGPTSRRDAWSNVVRARIADLESAMREAERMRRVLIEADACRCHDGDDCVVLRPADRRP